MNLIIKNLSKRFDDKVIFNNFSYEFTDNGLYFIEGKSGIGKTTLLRMICGLDKDFDGEICGGGLHRSSYVFQEHRLFPNLNLLKNVSVAFPKMTPEMTQHAKSLLIKLNFKEKDMELFPNELSGGMRQRASIARALLKSAPILLLDEPFKELDSALIDALIEIIKEESRKRLVILVTHTQVSNKLPESVTLSI